MEQQVLDDIINRLLEVRGRPGKQVQLSESEIRQLCSASRDIFLQQPNLLDLQAPIKICGTTFFSNTHFLFFGFIFKILLFLIFSLGNSMWVCLDWFFSGMFVWKFLTTPVVFLFLFLIFGSVSVLGVFHLILCECVYCWTPWRILVGEV